MRTRKSFNVGGQLLRKENAYVFDFDPARTLDIFEQFANDLSTSTSNGKGDMDERKRNIRELLNFFPVYGEDDDGEMIALDAEKVLSIPRKIHAQEVVRRGFMCNFLFQNIGNIFNAPQQVIDMITRLPATKEATPITPQTKDDLSLNEDGEVDIPTETIIGQAADIFGDKIYDVKENLSQAVSDLMTQSEPDDILIRLKEKFKDTLKDELIPTVKEQYGREMTKATENAVIRKINADTDSVIEKHYSNFKIQTNVLEAERKEELKTATRQEAEEINRRYEQKKEEAKQNFVADLRQKAEEITQNTAIITVQAVETDKKQREKNKIEEDVRTHLRGFSRTIPSFLMGYGTEQTTLENFDSIIPDKVFLEVTTLTLEEFRFLRDGGDYTDEETGETKHYDGHLFDPVVFNDSVKEFLALKKKLANYFDEKQAEDIFDYIPPQKNNQIFTPKKVVKEMVENLEIENPGCFDNPDHTFIDLYMKSGMYVAEIVKHLFNSPKLKTMYPDDADRLNHIFANQVFGLAPTEIIYRIALAYILGFDETIKIQKNNLKLFDSLPSVQQGTLEIDLDEVFAQ